MVCLCNSEKMKTFTLFAAAVLCIIFVAASAEVNESMKEKLGECLTEAGWTKEDWSNSCSNDPPTDEAELATFKDWVTCVLNVLEVVQESDSGIKVNAEKSAELVSPEKAPKIVELMTKCSERAEKASTLADGAMEIYTCLRETDKETYTAECLAAAASL